MPTIKKEIINDESIYTLRNTKGNELKISNIGAKIISLRFRNKNFDNKFLIKNSEVIIDGENQFAKNIWSAEEFVEGVRFKIKEGDKNISIVYSISNDNEISIKYNAEGIKDISTAIKFDSEVLKNPQLKIFSDEFKNEKFGEWSIIDKPAEVEFIEGMFGFDIGCPIDYYDAGLKNAAEIISDDENLILQIYASQNKIKITEDLTIQTVESKSVDGLIKSQTVYTIKNK